MKVRALLGAAVITGAAGLTVAVATPANAETRCNWHPADLGSGAAGTVDGPYQSYNLYKGNATSCGTSGTTLRQGNAIRVYCTYINSSNNVWAYIQTPFGVRGWMSTSNLDWNSSSGFVGVCL